MQGQFFPSLIVLKKGKTNNFKTDIGVLPGKHTVGHWISFCHARKKSFNFSNPTLLRLNVKFPGAPAHYRNNVGLESLRFFPNMAQVQPMTNKELFTTLNDTSSLKLALVSFHF